MVINQLDGQKMVEHHPNRSWIVSTGLSTYEPAKNGLFFEGYPVDLLKISSENCITISQKYPLIIMI